MISGLVSNFPDHCNVKMISGLVSNFPDHCNV